MRVDKVGLRVAGGTRTVLAAATALAALRRVCALVRVPSLPRLLSLTRAILRLGETAGSRACSAEIPPLRPASDASEPPLPPQTQNPPPSVTLNRSSRGRELSLPPGLAGLRVPVGRRMTAAGARGPAGSILTTAALAPYLLLHATLPLSVLFGSSAAGRELDVKSRRAQALAGADGVVFSVDDGGGATLGVAGTTFQLASSFSSPGHGDEPSWHNLTNGAAASTWSVAVNRSGAERGEWTVHAVPPQGSADFTVTRRYHLDPAPPARPVRVLINDTLTSRSDAILGVHVQHHARLLKGTVDNVQVPGRFEPGMCGTDGPNGNSAIFGYEDYEPHSTNFGAPHIWLNTSEGTGLGLVALDDVFRVHAQQRQFALASLNPRVDMNCPVHTPPSIRLSDPFLGLAAGSEYTLEWAVYPFGSNCSDWFCFVNSLRHSFETDTITVGAHSGSLQIMENTPSWDIAGGAHAGNMQAWNGTGYASEECLHECNPGDPRCLSGICSSINWTNWTSAQLQRFVTQQGTTVFPVANGWVPGAQPSWVCLGPLLYADIKVCT